MAAKKPGRSDNGDSTEQPGAASAGKAAAGKAGGAGRGGRRTAADTQAAPGGNGAADSGGRGTAAGSAGNPGAAKGGKAGAGRAAGGKAAAGKAGAGKAGAGKAGGARGGAAKSGGSKAARGGRAAKAAGGDPGDSALRKELRAFIEHHPHGWGHDEWTGLLQHLRNRGIDAGSEEQVGVELEKERVAHVLEGRNVSGLGSTRVRSLVERFGTLYSLRQASVEEIESVSGINRQLAERVHEAVR